MYLPSIIYEKEDGSGLSLYYDSGLWSIASSVGAAESLAYAEDSRTDPCTIPRSRWQVSDGATWVTAPARFEVFEIESDDEYEFDDGYTTYAATSNSRAALSDLQQGIQDLALGLVPKRQVRAKLDDMLETAREVEEGQLALEAELEDAEATLIEVSSPRRNVSTSTRFRRGKEASLYSPRTRRNLGLEFY